MKRRDAFTVTELLVLIPVSALLGATLLTSLDNAQQKVQAAACLSNMRQWGLAMGMYCNDYHNYMPFDGDSQIPIDLNYNLHAWYNVLSPYIGTPTLANLYHSGRAPAPGQKSVYMCPSIHDSAIPTVSKPYFAYAMNRVMSGGFGTLYRRSIARLPAQVIFLAESEAPNTGQSDVFSFTDGWFIGEETGVRAPRHAGGDNFLFIDGHAEWVLRSDYQRSSSESTDPTAEYNKPRKVYWFPCSTCFKGGGQTG